MALIISPILSATEWRFPVGQHANHAESSTLMTYSIFRWGQEGSFVIDPPSVRVLATQSTALRSAPNVHCMVQAGALMSGADRRSPSPCVRCSGRSCRGAAQGLALPSSRGCRPTASVQPQLKQLPVATSPIEPAHSPQWRSLWRARTDLRSARAKIATGVAIAGIQSSGLMRSRRALP
jgi:hypothetical protein